MFDKPELELLLRALQRYPWQGGPAEPLAAAEQVQVEALTKKIEAALVAANPKDQIPNSNPTG